MAGSSGSAKVEVVKGKRTMISKTASESGGGAERRVGGRSRFKKTLVQAAKVSLSLFNLLSGDGGSTFFSILVELHTLPPNPLHHHTCFSCLWYDTKYFRWSSVLFVNSLQRTDFSW